MADLPGFHQVGHGRNGLLDRHRRVDPVQVHQVDAFRPEPPQRSLDGLHDVFGAPVHDRPSVDHGHPAVFTVGEADLRRDRDVVADRGQGTAHETLVVTETVRLGGVEEGHSQFDGAP